MSLDHTLTLAEMSRFPTLEESREFLTIASLPPEMIGWICRFLQNEADLVNFSSSTASLRKKITASYIGSIDHKESFARNIKKDLETSINEELKQIFSMEAYAIVERPESSLFSAEVFKAADMVKNLKRTHPDEMVEKLRKSFASEFKEFVSKLSSNHGPFNKALCKRELIGIASHALIKACLDELVIDAAQRGSLVQEAIKGDFHSILSLLLHHPEGISQEDKNMALKRCSELGNVKAAKLLLENARFDDNTIGLCLIASCEQENIELAKIFLSLDQVNQQDLKDALLTCIEKNQMGILELCLQRDFSQEDLGIALINSAMHGNCEMISLLLQKGPFLEHDISFARQIALKNGHKKAAALLKKQDSGCVVS